MSQFFTPGGQSIKASASVLPVNEYSGLISLRTDWLQASLILSHTEKNPMDRGAWQATVHGVTRVGHDLGTKQQAM